MSDWFDNQPQGPQQPWEWPESIWRRAVEQVRAGSSLRPAAWPGGARCAVALSFDCDHETAALDAALPSPLRLSRGEYGARRGVPRLLAVLARAGVPATFFVPGVAALLHPEEVRAIADAGHEVALHSWIREPAVPGMRAAVERELLARAAGALEKLAGGAPVGMRTATRDFSPNTLAVARKLGLLYDSSLAADDDPYELLESGQPSGVVELPPTEFDAEAADAEERLRAEFDGALAEGGLFAPGLPADRAGRRARSGLLERLIAHMRVTAAPTGAAGAAPGGAAGAAPAGAAGAVWFATHAQVAHWCRAQAAAPATAQPGAAP